MSSGDPERERVKRRNQRGKTRARLFSRNPTANGRLANTSPGGSISASRPRTFSREVTPETISSENINASTM